jgi:hypothetical protein
VRIPIFLQAPNFDIKNVQSDIDATRKAFDDYLDYYKRKDARSKHGLMGPVGKILGEVRSGRRDPQSLKGYAIRVHEANQQYLSQEGIAALEKAINNLVGLLQPVPAGHVDTVVDRLDYALYFSRRKKVVEEREVLNCEFRTFLQERYKDLLAVAAAWGETISDWSRVYVFGPTSKTYKKASDTKKGDIAAFWKHQEAQAKAPAEILLEEE